MVGRISHADFYRRACFFHARLMLGLRRFLRQREFVPIRDVKHRVHAHEYVGVRERRVRPVRAMPEDENIHATFAF
jgi:hypothetical protein